MVSAGYKYIYWDLGEDNADIYMDRIMIGQPIHHAELSDCRGMYDKVEMPGIYFCKSLEDLYVWIKELLEFVDPYAIEVLEVKPVGDVKERQYEDGRVAYVAPSVIGRVMEDQELTPELHELLSMHFD